MESGKAADAGRETRDLRLGIFVRARARARARNRNRNWVDPLQSLRQTLISHAKTQSREEKPRRYNLTDQRPTTNDQRPTTNDQRPPVRRAPIPLDVVPETARRHSDKSLDFLFCENRGPHLWQGDTRRFLHCLESLSPSAHSL